MASDEMVQAFDKHIMGDSSEFDALNERFKERSEFDALKKRFASASYMSIPAAAALGYLIAKDELEAAKEE